MELSRAISNQRTLTSSHTTGSETTLPNNNVSVASTRETATPTINSPSSINPLTVQGIPEVSSIEQIQEEFLIRLSKKIEEKKKEMTIFLDSAEASIEEKMDKDRAIARLDRLMEIPRDNGYFKYLRQHHQVFSEYVTYLLNEVLEASPRTLNYALANTPNTASEFKTDVKYDNRNNESKVRTSLPIYDLNGEYIYLPKLPIVVEISKLSDEQKTIIKRSANFIHISKWLDKYPDQFKDVESIKVNPDIKALGQAGKEKQIVIKIANRTSLSVANTIIHESEHKKQTYRDEDFQVFNEEQKERSIERSSHPYVDNGYNSHIYPRELLRELFAYEKERRFALEFINAPSNTNMTTTRARVKEELLADVKFAQQAVEILHGQKDLCSDRFNKKVEEVAKYWEDLEKDALKL